MQNLFFENRSFAYGDFGRGMPLLLIHGFPLDHSMWIGQSTALAPRCRVLVPDLRGFGHSDPVGEVATMEQMADDLASLLDALAIREPVVVGGLSMGGYIAFEFWRKYADRVKGLILCDTRATADTPETAANRLVTADRVLRDGMVPLADTMLFKLFAEPTCSERPEVVEAVRQSMLHANPRGVAAAARGMAQRRDFSPDLPRLDCPALILVGENDVLSPPSEMKTLADAIPSARFQVIPSAGHMAPLEQPEAVNAAIESFFDAFAF